MSRVEWVALSWANVGEGATCPGIAAVDRLVTGWWCRCHNVGGSGGGPSCHKVGPDGVDSRRWGNRHCACGCRSTGHRGLPALLGTLSLLLPIRLSLALGLLPSRLLSSALLSRLLGLGLLQPLGKIIVRLFRSRQALDTLVCPIKSTLCLANILGRSAIDLPCIVDIENDGVAATIGVFGFGLRGLLLSLVA